MKKKWETVGYHIIIDRDGNIHNLLSEEFQSNGVKGNNQNSVHVCYVGGIDGKDTRTEKQKDSLLIVLKKWKNKYSNALILGHRDFPDVQKDCPCFDAKKEYCNL